MVDFFLEEAGFVCGAGAQMDQRRATTVGLSPRRDDADGGGSLSSLVLFAPSEKGRPGFIDPSGFQAQPGHNVPHRVQVRLDEVGLACGPNGCLDVFEPIARHQDDHPL